MSWSEARTAMMACSDGNQFCKRGFCAGYSYNLDGQQDCMALIVSLHMRLSSPLSP